MKRNVRAFDMAARLRRGAVCVLLAAAAATGARAAEPDWSGYAALLQHYVSPGTSAGVTLNLVDYAGLGSDPAFAEVVSALEAFPLEQLESRDETLAFYINAYNILALKMVVDEKPADSIRDIGSLFRPVWKRRAGMLGGEAVTLDEIEHERLRKMGDPRIHFAIVCASISCPDLRTEPYRAGQLNAELDAQAEAFLNNPGKGLRVADGRVEVSQIFKWFKADFEAGGGVAAFIRRYHPLPADATVTPAIDYNWSLNRR